MGAQFYAVVDAVAGGAVAQTGREIFIGILWGQPKAAIGTWPGQNRRILRIFDGGCGTATVIKSPIVM